MMTQSDAALRVTGGPASTMSAGAAADLAPVDSRPRRPDEAAALALIAAALLPTRSEAAPSEARGPASPPMAGAVVALATFGTVYFAQSAAAAGLATTRRGAAQQVAASPTTTACGAAALSAADQASCTRPDEAAALAATLDASILTHREAARMAAREADASARRGLVATWPAAHWPRPAVALMRCARMKRASHARRRHVEHQRLW